VQSGSARSNEVSGADPAENARYCWLTGHRREHPFPQSVIGVRTQLAGFGTGRRCALDIETPNGETSEHRLVFRQVERPGNVSRTMSSAVKTSKKRCSEMAMEEVELVGAPRTLSSTHHLAAQIHYANHPSLRSARCQGRLEFSLTVRESPLANKVSS